MDSDDDDDNDNLYEAVRLGKIEQVRKIVDRKCLDSVEFSYFLHYAATCGQEAIARLIITNYSCPVDCREQNNRTPLHVACGKGDLNMVKMLVNEQNANLHVYDIHNVTPLHEAARSGNTELVLYLIVEHKKFDPELKLKDCEGKTILHYASQAGHHELVDRLITHYNMNPESAGLPWQYSSTFSCR